MNNKLERFQKVYLSYVQEHFSRW